VSTVLRGPMVFSHNISFKSVGSSKSSGIWRYQWHGHMEVRSCNAVRNTGLTNNTHDDTTTQQPTTNERDEGNIGVAWTSKAKANSGGSAEQK
jgi:hypothetical protein